MIVVVIIKQFPSHFQEMFTNSTSGTYDEVGCNITNTIPVGEETGVSISRCPEARL